MSRQRKPVCREKQERHLQGCRSKRPGEGQGGARAPKLQVKSPVSHCSLLSFFPITDSRYTPKTHPKHSVTEMNGEELKEKG